MSRVHVIVGLVIVIVLAYILFPLHRRKSLPYRILFAAQQGDAPVRG